MLRLHFYIALRNLLRSRGFSAINLSGLAVGMAGALLILLWIQNEVSYDRFHTGGDRLYEAWNRVKRNGRVETWNVTPSVLAPTLTSDFPEVEQTVRVMNADVTAVSNGQKALNGEGKIVDPNFFALFSFPLLQGHAGTVLKEPTAVVITESFAKKFFGNDDPGGRTLRINSQDNFTVTGVMKDLPANTRFRFDYLVPWTYLEGKGYSDGDWGNNNLATFVRLKPHVNTAALASKLATLRERYDKAEPVGGFFLHPAKDWQLRSGFENGVQSGGRITIVRMFAILAGFLLLIACINFMNLSTARSQKRSKEVGVRKVMGAGRSSLVKQFLGESVLLSFLSGLGSLVLVQLCLPAFNGLVEKSLALPVGNPFFWLLWIGFVLLTGLLAGSYPAFFLSAFKPVKVLKGGVQPTRTLIGPRKVLVVLQFAFAITLIIGTLVVKQQINHAQNRAAGYNRQALIYHTLGEDLKQHYTALKNELLASGAVASVTKTSSPLIDAWSNTWGLEWPGKNPNDKTIFDRYVADEGLVKTAGLHLVQGRDFDRRRFPSDSASMLLNETAVKTIGLRDPIGQVLHDNGRAFRVVGVIRDFILTSPFQPVQPMFITGDGWFNNLHIKLTETMPLQQSLSILERIFKKFNPDAPFDPHFADEAYALKFDSERRTAAFTTVFAGLSIFISCLGLFGLAVYMAQNRVKEIGVRKVLGASVTAITVLLTKDFVKPVLLAFVLAAPLGWWAMQGWLRSFAYRISIGWWVFAIAGAGALLIAVFTVGVQAVKAALANPVKSLRTE